MAKPFIAEPSRDLRLDSLLEVTLPLRLEIGHKIVDFALTGDAAAGEKIFFGKGECNACHEVNERGAVKYRTGPFRCRTDLPGVLTVNMKDGREVRGIPRRGAFRNRTASASKILRVPLECPACRAAAAGRLCLSSRSRRCPRCRKYHTNRSLSNSLSPIRTAAASGEPAPSVMASANIPRWSLVQAAHRWAKQVYNPSRLGV
jgi:hypothetical protein